MPVINHMPCVVFVFTLLLAGAGGYVSGHWNGYLDGHRAATRAAERRAKLGPNKDSRG